MIHIKNLTKTYKNKTIFLETSAIFTNEKINFLRSENGTGKTTLFYIIAGIKKMDKGEIYLGDEKINFLDGSYRNKIGFLFDLPTFPYHYKVSEYITLLKTVYKITDNNYVNEIVNF